MKNTTRNYVISIDHTAKSGRGFTTLQVRSDRNSIAEHALLKGQEAGDFWCANVYAGQKGKYMFTVSPNGWVDVNDEMLGTTLHRSPENA